MPEWPYDDARQNDPLTELRIPVVNHPWFRWRYIVAFDCGALDGAETRPTEQEAEMLVSFLEEFKTRYYGNSGFAERLRERPFDIDGGANGFVFRKWGNDDWSYQRHTWETGYFPDYPGNRQGSTVKAHTLEQLMDRIHGYASAALCPDWAKWKADHPDVFPGGGR